MWSSISRSIPGFGRRKNTTELLTSCHDFSDDENSSNTSTDEGLECPICCESFNIVENVPHVLWCGHTLCKNCVLGLRWTVFKFSGQFIRVPFVVSCPWCDLPTFRFFHRGGGLTFPRKNFFLLWMVEARNGDRVARSPPSIGGKDGQQMVPAANGRMHRENSTERVQLSFHKSIDFFFRMTAKLPLVVLLLVVLFAIPASGAVLLLYLAITVVFAIPAFLVVYFSYPALDWLGREIGT